MYGTSFSAIGNEDKVTNEYNKNVYTYNNQANGLTNKNSDVDGKRGYYARWDATQGQCLVRVAAYNNNKLVTNSWLWGAIGDDTPAEVWKKTGDSFKCNKDLFGFALLNNTKTVALVGVGGGTLLGAGIGAATGHKKRDFNCNNEGSRTKLFNAIGSNNMGILNEYMDEPVKASATTFTSGQCNEVVNLINRTTATKSAIAKCRRTFSDTFVDVEVKLEYPGVVEGQWKNINEFYNARVKPCYRANEQLSLEACQAILEESTFCDGATSEKECKNAMSKNGVIDRSDAGETSDSYVSIKTTVQGCFFKPISKVFDNEDILCEKPQSKECLTVDEINADISELSAIINTDAVDTAMEQEKSTIGRNAGIGAATGAAAGGVATAITAFVERSNISCHVGDNLAKVSMGKSYNIETLREFYVKWGMNLSDLQPTETSTVTTKAQWSAACSKYNNDLDTCLMLKVKVDTNNVTETVSSACRVQSGRCVANDLVMTGYQLN